jgi:hypothetical protein
VPEPATRQSSKKALIAIGTGHDGIKKGVRLNSDKYFDQSARNSFAPYTKGHDVHLVHVDSAKEMRDLIEGGTWNVVLYFGHGVENQMALAPKEGGTLLSMGELAKALQKAQATQVYLFGCKAGQTGLARKLSKEVPGATVHGTFGSLDVDWEQRMGPDKTFTNRFIFKEALTDYKGGFQTKDGKRTKQRRRENDDPLTIDGDPLGEMVDQ